MYNTVWDGLSLIDCPLRIVKREKKKHFTPVQSVENKGYESKIRLIYSIKVTLFPEF